MDRLFDVSKHRETRNHVAGMLSPVVRLASKDSVNTMIDVANVTIPCWLTVAYHRNASKRWIAFFLLFGLSYNAITSLPCAFYCMFNSLCASKQQN